MEESMCATRRELYEIWRWNTATHLFMLVAGGLSLLFTSDFEIVIPIVVCSTILFMLLGFVLGDEKIQSAPGVGSTMFTSLTAAGAAYLYLMSEDDLLLFFAACCLLASILMVFAGTAPAACSVAKLIAEVHGEEPRKAPYFAFALMGMPLGIGSILGGAVLLWQRWREQLPA